MTPAAFRHDATLRSSTGSSQYCARPDLAHFRQMRHRTGVLGCICHWLTNQVSDNARVDQFELVILRNTTSNLGSSLPRSLVTSSLSHDTSFLSFGGGACRDPPGDGDAI